MFGYYLGLAWRRCRQNVAMVALLVLTMAIGIASCMTATTIFGALSGEPLPGISDHLYVVTMDGRQETDNNNPSYDAPISLLNARDARALVHAGRARRQMAVAPSLARMQSLDGKVSEQAIGELGYGPVLGLLGIRLRYGRPWTPVEQDTHEPVVVIDSGVAKKLFGTEDAVGKTLRMGQRHVRVVGVMAPWKSRLQFLGLQQNKGGMLGRGVQFFMPFGSALDAGVGPLNAGKCGKQAPVATFQSTHLDHCRWLETWVQLDTASQVRDYTAFLAGYARSQQAAGRFVYPPRARLYGARAWMDVNQMVPDDVGLNLMLASGFLVLCMINVAGLLAARFLRRQGDVAIRRALGAARRHAFAQHLVEAGLLGAMGGLLAVPLTLLGLWIVRMQPVSYASAAQFNVPVFIGLLGLSLAVGLIVGILPAWRVCRQPPALQIKLV